MFESLLLRISKASQAYYSGDPIISDEEFDKLIEELALIRPDHPMLSTTGWGYRPSGEEKIAHSHLISGLPKKRIEHLSKMEYLRYSVLSLKLDGGSVVAYYKRGVLDSVVSRGNGEEGLDITSNLLHTVPRYLPIDEDIAIRGEVCLTWSDFGKIGGSHPRNVAVGLSQSKFAGENTKYLKFVAFSILSLRSKKSEQLLLLDKWGFQVVPYYFVVDIPYEELIGNIPQELLKFPYDGIVLSDESDVSIAVKYCDEIYEACIGSLIWQVGRTGKIVPVANLSTSVCIDGVWISYVTCHNIGFVRNYGIGAGSIVQLVRSGGVIPKIVGVISRAETVTFPERCGSCNSDLVLSESNLELYCPNIDCIVKLENVLLRIFEKNRPDGIGEVSLSSLVGECEEAGFVCNSSIPMRNLLYGLRTVIESRHLLSGELVSVNLKKEMLSSIESYTPSISELIWMANIPSVGEKACENFSEFLKEEFLMILETGVVPGHLGRLFPTSVSLSNFIRFLGRIKLLLEFFGGVTEERKIKRSGILEGLAFCITGTLSKKRNEIIEIIDSCGGVFENNAAKVDFLIVGETPGEGKLSQVKKGSARIISERDFEKMAGLGNG